MNFQKNTKQFLSFGVFLFLSLIFLDQILKYVIFSYLHNFEFSKFVKIQLYLNDQFAFSLPINTNLIFTIYFLVLVLIFWYLEQKFFTLPKTSKTAGVFILSGAFSNIGERIYFGYVKDYLYIFSGIFNLADIYIILGIFLILFFQERSEK
jgi:lipoprotein signal peptidase